MAEIIGGFLVPHSPVMFVAPHAPPRAQCDAVFGAYAAMAARIGALGATTAIVIGCDHYILFGPGCLPQYVIGTGDVEGPIDQLPGLKRGPIPSNPALARHIAATGSTRGFDFAVGRAMTVDHSVAIPHRLMVAPNPGVTTIPIMLACGVDPYLPMRRAYDLGRLIAEAVASFPGDDRVVVIGSGGISHWVGDENAGRVEEGFDRMVIDAVTRGDAEALLALDDATILEQGGNGAMEIRTFLCAMGACGSIGGTLVAYEPVPEWLTGLGFLELEAA